MPWRNNSWPHLRRISSDQQLRPQLRTPQVLGILLLIERAHAALGLQDFPGSRYISQHTSNVSSAFTAIASSVCSSAHTAAVLARWLIEQREHTISAGEEPAAQESIGSDGQSASDNFLVDRFVPPNGSRARS